MSESNKNSAKKYLIDNYSYYDTKSVLYKRWYSFLTALDIFIASTIPFTTLFIDSFFWIKYAIALMGSITAILSSLKATFAFHKNWIEYRSTAEILKFHQYLYETKSSPYNQKNRDEILILNIHAIVEVENNNWKSFLLKNNKIYINNNPINPIE
ncbi:DUF4231 domain-containing protein [Clostridium sp. UBA1652]|uniref:DUF4231 domain-containing protein n=1 Tax=Clostridium sp. UBA1652 TaxID=1946348 RepID=UPI00257AE8F3|nr:DUF4231 domain-containing protein [Clostridium sp. UBA1652]